MESKNIVRGVAMCALPLTIWVMMQAAASAQAGPPIAPDPTDVGPFEIASGEYKLPTTLDLLVSGMPTELWARVFWPVASASPPFPLLVFLHGNHATCGRGANPRIDDNTQYTFYGTCPPGYEVTPNHAGYDYIAERLASWGYIVVSINANRGVTAAPGTSDDLGVNLVRGRLILRHLQQLSEWNTNGGTPESLGVDLQGMINFRHVGLFGHSRGGEGVRAAYQQYFDENSPWPALIREPVNFAGIFEIGPVDGQTGRQLDPSGTTWLVLLPMCDGDVSNLQGIKPLDRMLAARSEPFARPKSSLVVWGANHNYYNGEWQLSDSAGCSGSANVPLFTMPVGSAEQRQTGLVAAMAFFRGNVGPQADPRFNQNFNPEFAPTPALTSVTRVDRGWTDSPDSSVTTVFEDFDQATGTNTYGVPNDASNITIQHAECSGDPSIRCPDSIPNHNGGDSYGRFGLQQTAAISWTAAGADTFFQTNWSLPGSGLDIREFRTLDLRVSRQCATSSCQAPSELNPAEPTNFSIRLAMGDGSLSDPVQLSTYSDLRGPIGGLAGVNPNLHPILQSVRIPLQDFGHADLTNVRGVRLVFDDTSSGAIYVANVRLSVITGITFPSARLTAAAGSGQAAASAAAGANQIITQGNRITIRAVGASNALPNNQPGYEVEVTSDVAFDVRDELLTLKIGDMYFALSRYSDDGDTHKVIFTLSNDQFSVVKAGDPVTVQYGTDESKQWLFGPLNKMAP